MQTVDALIAVRELLADPEHWTKGTSARDANGADLVERLTDEYADYDAADLAASIDQRAVCWCIGGALSHVLKQRVRYDDRRFTVLWELMGGKPVGPWNDEHTHEDVLWVLDEAVKRAAAFPSKEDSDAQDA